MSQQLARGYVIAIIGIIIWSLTGVLISALITTYHLPALALAFWRNLLVCVALVPALLVFRPALLRLHHAHLGFALGYGFALAVLNAVWTLSVQANGAAVATVLVYSSAGFTAILAWWRFREHLGLAKLLAIALSLGGCLMVSGAYRAELWTLNLLGISTGLLSGLLFALYTLFGKEAARRGISAWTALLYSFGIGSLFLLLFNLIPGLPGATGVRVTLPPELPLHGWLLLGLLAVGPTLLGYGLYTLALRDLPASIANLLATLEPALTAVEAYVLLDERMSGVQIAGGLIIVAAVLIVQLERAPAAPHPQPPRKLREPA